MGFLPNLALIGVFMLLGAVFIGGGIVQKRFTRLSRRARRYWFEQFTSWGVIHTDNPSAAQLSDDLARRIQQVSAPLEVGSGFGLILGGLIAGAALFAIRDTLLIQSFSIEYPILTVMLVSGMVGLIITLLRSHMPVISRAEGLERIRSHRPRWLLPLVLALVFLFCVVTLLTSSGLFPSASYGVSQFAHEWDPRRYPWVIWLLPASAALTILAVEIAIRVLSVRDHPNLSPLPGLSLLISRKVEGRRLTTFIYYQCFFPALMLMRQVDLLPLDTLFALEMILNFSALALFFIGFLVFLAGLSDSSRQRGSQVTS